MRCCCAGSRRRAGPSEHWEVVPLAQPPAVAHGTVHDYIRHALQPCRAARELADDRRVVAAAGLDDDDGARLRAMHHPEAAVIIPPRATAVPSDTAESTPTQRDRHLQCIAAHGRMGWQKASDYTTRARAEAAIGRWKQVIGDGLRSRTDERRTTEVDVAVYALNRMLELGRPTYIRIV